MVSDSNRSCTEARCPGASTAATSTRWRHAAGATALGVLLFGERLFRSTKSVALFHAPEVSWPIEGKPRLHMGYRINYSSRLPGSQVARGSRLRAPWVSLGGSGGRLGAFHGALGGQWRVLGGFPPLGSVEGIGALHFVTFPGQTWKPRSAPSVFGQVIGSSE